MNKYLDGRNRNSYYKKKKQKVEPLFKKQDLLEKEVKEKNLQSYLNSRIIDSNLVPNNPELDNLSQKIMKNRDELIKINQKLVLDRLQSQPEHANLVFYIKDPPFRPLEQKIAIYLIITTPF
ncbi:hypothetical protein OC709_01905 ['Planchonia careya' phytoplasma]|nr:hypothetical protein ['Planchonia careya' phytoplasma]MDO8030256.1 hypothetical protein ['Planchonia careya' phytoplasma]